MGSVPKLGQHSREVLLESGLTEGEIADLERNGIVQCLPRALTDKIASVSGGATAPR